MSHQIRGITVDALARKAIREHSSQLNDITQNIKAIVVCTQAEYDALTPDSTTVYLISG